MSIDTDFSLCYILKSVYCSQHMPLCDIFPSPPYNSYFYGGIRQLPVWNRTSAAFRSASSKQCPSNNMITWSRPYMYEYYVNIRVIAETCHTFSITYQDMGLYPLIGVVSYCQPISKCSFMLFQTMIILPTKWTFQVRLQ